MKRLKFLYSKTLLHYLLQEAWIRWYWKFVLPKIREVDLEGLRLDLSAMSLKVRNRILHVGYETQEARMCKCFLNSNDAVLELGGAIGFIALLCQKTLGIRNYTVVEANPRTLEVLKRNYQLNDLTPLAWNLALAEADGSVELEVGSDFWENSIVASNNGDGRKTIDVPAMTFRQMIERVHHPINVLIIDVEGAEQFIDFAAIPDTINKIIIELHPKVLGPQRTHEIISHLLVKGFRVAQEEDGTFVFLRSNCQQEGMTSPSERRVTSAPSNAEISSDVLSNGFSKSIIYAR